MDENNFHNIIGNNSSVLLHLISSIAMLRLVLRLFSSPPVSNIRNFFWPADVLLLTRSEWKPLCTLMKFIMLLAASIVPSKWSSRSRHSASGWRNYILMWNSKETWSAIDEFYECNLIHCWTKYNLRELTGSELPPQKDLNVSKNKFHAAKIHVQHICRHWKEPRWSSEAMQWLFIVSCTTFHLADQEMSTLTWNVNQPWRVETKS